MKSCIIMYKITIQLQHFRFQSIYSPLSTTTKVLISNITLDRTQKKKKRKESPPLSYQTHAPLPLPTPTTLTPSQNNFLLILSTSGLIPIS